MYSVTVTPGRSSEKQSTSRSKETELYKSRRRESVPVRVLNYIRSQFQAEGVSEGELEELGGVLGGSGGGTLALGGRHKPEELATLAANTRFSRKEIQLIYRGFKQECPTGLVDEEAFKQIFSQFFPQGDASQYAHYVFNTMKRKHSGKISFEEFLTILSKVSRGSVEEKLQWVFGLYDLDGDGLIRKEEMLDVVGSIYEMLGRYTQPQIVEPHLAAREHVDRIFHLMDANKDGVVTIEELVQWCSKDEQLLRSLDTLDTVL
ncbi:Kv channel-interacting protein 1-like isoform X1 [Polistes fuscatus]|uniref:Kv channel-interacting protein 1-like isoform X1 n=2 Tax=Polistes TaxID=7456 RepID=A0ABM1J536_POLDO|nr:PREDICTED: Kv channel-interacting protein 1-like isoform X1 [Polistes dominula]XP_043494643.1 Kv channel-interacting protein 1-like isoform X1 [Polistes fuscatus]